MSKIADNTGIASLSMLDRIMGPLKADKTRNVITAIGDMTPMAPDIRKMIGAEPMGMGESLLSASSLITGIPVAVMRTMTRSIGSVDEAFDILKTFKTDDEMMNSISDMYRAGLEMKESGGKMGVIQGSNLINNAQRLLKKSQDEFLINRNVNLDSFNKLPANRRITEISEELLPPLTQTGRQVTGGKKP